MPRLPLAIVSRQSGQYGQSCQLAARPTMLIGASRKNPRYQAGAFLPAHRLPAPKQIKKAPIQSMGAVKTQSVLESRFLGMGFAQNFIEQEALQTILP